MASQDWQQASHIVQAALTRPTQERDKFIAEACKGNELLQQEVEILLRYYTASEAAKDTEPAAQSGEAKAESEPLEQWWQPPRKSGKLSQPSKRPADWIEQAKPIEADSQRRPTDDLQLPPLAEPAARNTAPLVAGNSTIELINELASGSERLKAERRTGDLPPLKPQNAGDTAAPGAGAAEQTIAPAAPPPNSGQPAPPPQRPSFDQASRVPVFEQPARRVSFDQPTYSPLFAQKPAPPKPEPPRSPADFDQDSFRTKFGFDQPSVRPNAEVGPTGQLRAPETRQLDGRRLAHYQLQYELGRGGMARVYLAEDTRLGRRVALKLMLRHSTRDPERVRRFQQEARAASGLNHPNILTIYEVGEYKGVQYLATEYVEGRTLRALLDRGRFKVSIAVNIAIQIASALETAHRANIVHRDVKPENLMLRPDGYVKVLDFGIAKLIEHEGEASSSGTGESGQVETKPGIVIGTINYMSPEQARGLRVDRRTDVFSLGVVLYEMITGRCPFTGPTQSDVLAALLACDPEPLALQSLTAPINALQKLQLILNRVLEKDRNLRYQSARELADELKALKKELEMGAPASAAHTKELAIDQAATAVTAAEPTFGQTEEVKIRPSGEMALATSTEQKRAAPGQPAAATTGATTAETAQVQPARPNDRSRRIAMLMLGLCVLLALLLAAYGGYYYWQRGKQTESIAVLPFEFAKTGRSGEAEHEYLADGLTESLIQRLSQAAGLKVIARNSVFRYKGKMPAPDPREVGLALNVRNVLHGKLTPQGENLLLSVELVDTQSRTVVWSQQFENNAGDLPTLQRDLANRIAEQLRLRLTGVEQQRLARRDTENAEAYKLYLKGRHLWNQRTGEALKKSIEAFQRAVLLDPNYARAYAGLADSYALAPIYSDLAPEEAALVGKDAINRALQLDPNLAEPYAALGFVRFQYDWNWAGAEQAYQRALALNDNYATAHHWYSSFLNSMGRFGEALGEAERARELDPVSTSICTNLGAVLFYARRYDEAIAQFQKALELNPYAAGVHAHLGMAYEQKRDYHKAVAEFQRALELSKGDVPRKLQLARALALAGKQPESRRMLTALQQNPPPGTVPLYLVAAVHAGLGEKEQALEQLKQAVLAHDEDITLLKIDPRFEPLRSEPRFNDLLKSVGLVK